MASSPSFNPLDRLSAPGFARWDLTPEEWRSQLRGSQGIKNRREMARSPYGAAILRASTLTYRRLGWRAEPASDGEADRAAAEFLESCIGDMSTPWANFVNQAVENTFEQGFALFEQVYKKRAGEQDPAGDLPSSKFTDGRIGWRSFAVIPADTINDDWDIPPGESWQGVWQTTTYSGRVYIPKLKSVLFRLNDRTGSPVGAGGIFDDAYYAWYFLTNLQRVQAITIERHGGIPVVKLGPGATWDDTVGTDYYNAKQIVERFRLDEQAGFVVPNGIEVSIQSPGEGSKDTLAVIEAYKRDFFLAALAQWAMLGANNVGSWALSKDQSDFFIMALSGWLGSIAQTLNDVVVPRLFKLNAFPGLTGYPRLVHDPVTERDATDFADALDKFATSMWITPQPEDEEYLRRKLGLPERTAEDIQKQQEEKAAQMPVAPAVQPVPVTGATPVTPASATRLFERFVEELAATRMQLAQLQDSQEAR